MKLRVEESCDSITLILDDNGEKLAGSWDHHDTHEELFRDLCVKLGIEFEYEEVY